MSRLTNGTNSLNTTITLDQQTNNVVTLSTSNSYVEKNIELTLNVQSGSAAVPDTTINTNPIISIDNTTGLITATTSASQSISPTISSGWIGSGTAGTITVSGSNTNQLSVTSAATITPGLSDIIIPSGYYLTGAQTIKGDANLLAENIVDGVTIFGVSGTYSSSGGDDYVYTIDGPNNKLILNFLNGADLDFLPEFLEGTLVSYYNPEVTTLRNYAFYSCTSIQDLNLPNCSVIPDNTVFSGCTNLSSINIGVVTLPQNVFQNLANLKTVILPSCTSMPYSNAFAGCTNLDYISANVTVIIQSFFSGKNKLITAYFPNCLTIQSNTFWSCTLLTTASFPTCTTISNSAFRNCTSLTTISFPACTTIGNNAFDTCTSLSEAYFDQLVTFQNYSQNTSPFSGCTELSNISLPLCATIGSWTFAGTGITNLYLPECTTIGNYAFRSCKSLANVSCPKCATLGTYVFQNCTNLLTVYLGNLSSFTNYSATSAPFSGCTLLSEIYLPVCTNIGSFTFNGCTKLMALYLNSPTMCTLKNSNAFNNTAMITSVNGVYGSIYVPTSLVNNYKAATNWSFFANRITAIPA